MKLSISTLAVLLASAAHGVVTLSGTAPAATDVIASNNTGGIFSRIFDIDNNANHARGQLFNLSTPALPDTAYQISGITVHKNGAQTFSNDAMTLRMFEGTQADWTTGTGRHSSNPDFFSGTSVTPLTQRPSRSTGRSTEASTSLLSSPTQ